MPVCEWPLIVGRVVRRNALGVYSRTIRIGLVFRGSEAWWALASASS